MDFLKIIFQGHGPYFFNTINVEKHADFLGIFFRELREQKCGFFKHFFQRCKTEDFSDYCFKDQRAKERNTFFKNIF